MKNFWRKEKKSENVQICVLTSLQVQTAKAGQNNNRRFGFVGFVDQPTSYHEDVHLFFAKHLYKLTSKSF